MLNQLMIGIALAALGALAALFIDRKVSSFSPWNSELAG